MDYRDTNWQRIAETSTAKLAAAEERLKERAKATLFDRVMNTLSCGLMILGLSGLVFSFASFSWRDHVVQKLRDDLDATNQALDQTVRINREFAEENEGMRRRLNVGFHGYQGDVGIVCHTTPEVNGSLSEAHGGVGNGGTTSADTHVMAASASGTITIGTTASTDAHWLVVPVGSP